MEMETLRRHKRGARRTLEQRTGGGDVPPEPAVHAESAANGVVEYASGRAPRSTAAAWDKRETITW